MNYVKKGTKSKTKEFIISITLTRTYSVEVHVVQLSTVTEKS